MTETKTKRITGRRLQAIRQEVLRASPLCIKCKANGVVSLATEVDHIKSLFAGGDESMGNRQALCTDCHKEKTQIDLGSKITSGSDANGMPTRHAHHWNT
jgi:5-methylcytosine-specific restriction enzyme A